MSLFQYIKEHIAIMDVVGRYVRLKPAGTYYKGSCPFHQETDASFTVSPDRQIFYCFGCQAGGDVISFIARVENLGQMEAARHLIEEYSLSLPAGVAKEAAVIQKHAGEKKSFFAVCSFVAQWTHEQLKYSSDAQAYVAKRMISEEIRNLFSIGYFPGGAQAAQLLVQAAARKNILVKDLLRAGVLFDSRSALRSPFEERIIFPITDTLGRACGFGGRVFLPHDTRAKYYNSKESEFFIKGKLLFGFDLAKKSMREQRSVFLVEGYTDCIAMVQHGYPHTIATLGTACTQDHLQLLARYVDVVFVLYDGDKAGEKAIIRLTELCWHSNIELRVVRLPGDADPAEYLSEHQTLDAVISKAQDIFSFFVRSVGNNFTQKPLAQKLGAVEKILNLVARFDDLIKKELLLQQASEVLQVSIDALRGQLVKLQKPHVLRGDSYKVEQEEVVDERVALEERIVSACLHSLSSEKRHNVPEAVQDCFSDQAVRLFTCINKVCEGKDTEQAFNGILNGLSSDDRDWVIRIYMRYDAKLGKKEFTFLIGKMIQHNWKDVVKKMRAALQQASSDGDSERIQALLHTFTQLKQGMQRKGFLYEKKEQ